jgi:hypothetical protein
MDKYGAGLDWGVYFADVRMHIRFICCMLPSCRCSTITTLWKRADTVLFDRAASIMRKWPGGGTVRGADLRVVDGGIPSEVGGGPRSGVVERGVPLHRPAQRHPRVPARGELGVGGGGDCAVGHHVVDGVARRT